MPIEILYLLPIIAFSTFLFLLLVIRQQHKNRAEQGSATVVPAAPVPEESAAAAQSAENRLKEIEETTTQITTALSSHQQVVSRFTEENDFYKKEIAALKNKLRDIQKEYDITLSENYSLRARVNKLKDNLQKQEERASGMEAQGEVSDAELKTGLRIENLPAAAIAAAGTVNGVNRSLYEDTRLIAIMRKDDTADVDVVNLD